MKRQANITITKADNGYVIECRSDDRGGQKLVAKDDQEVKEILVNLADHLFDPLPEKSP